MPEPLPKDDPLWSAPNILISMHMSGRSQSGISRKGAERFVENLRRYISGQPMISVVDLSKEIGRAHVRTPVTNAHLVCRLLLEKKNYNIQIIKCKSKRHKIY